MQSLVDDNAVAHKDFSHVREREMDRIMMFFNDPNNQNRVNITKQEVAVFCNRTNTSSKIFRASFKEAERRNLVREVRPNGRRTGRFALV